MSSTGPKAPRPGAVVERFLQRRAFKGNPLDNQDQRKAARMVNQVIGRVNLRGFFSDEFWRPVQAIWKALGDAGLPFAITKSEYEAAPGTRFPPIRKVWTFEIPYTNKRGRKATVYGRVVAAGAGPEEDPLSTYDVTAYAN